MFLKSLTLKGFKSFADPTTLELRPGVTVVVGPNGSGKSNVVDAVAWVLGAQGPRVVRSAKMDDVIFAGTERRPALGRAEVTLTIDNVARRIPVDLNEINVTRTLFRTGESEYALNGAPCRLLDIQELLSDTGVGRQQHVIISQGQLDSVLGARPEERRAVVEEAAGILKYRRRRERAERRLESSEAGLARLQDLLREVRRQIRPLERQAASALRHDVLAEELGALRLYLAGRELVVLDGRLAADGAEGARLAGECATRAAELAELEEALAAEEVVGGQEDADRLTPAVSRLERGAERAAGLLALARERRSAKGALFAASLDAGEVAGLESELAEVHEELDTCEQEAVGLAPEWEGLVEAEGGLAAREAVDVERFAAPAAEGADRDLRARRAEHDAARDALARAREAEIRAGERAAALERRRADAGGALGTAEAADGPLAAARSASAQLADQATGALAEAERTASEAAEGRRRAEEVAHGAVARVEALGLALSEARARAGLERLAELDGVVGTLLDVVEVDEALLPAFEAAVEGALDAVLLDGPPAARRALGHLREAGATGAVLPLGLGLGRAGEAAAAVAPPAGTRPLRGSVQGATAAVDELLDQLLRNVVVAPGGVDVAVTAALAVPGLTVVTPEGDRLSPTGWRLGAQAAGATRAALEAAEAAATAARAAVGTAVAADQAAARALVVARERSVATLRAADTAAAEAGRNDEVLARARAALAGLAGEVAEAIEAVARRREAMAAATEALERAAAAREAAEAEEAARAERRREAASARAARESEARALASLRRELEVRAAALEERRSMLAGRAVELERRLAGRREARAGAEARRAAHARDDRALDRLATSLAALEGAARAAARRAGEERDRRQAAARARLERASALRRRRDEVERALADARERRQRLELSATETRVRREAAVEALGRDLEATVEAALAAPAPPLGEGVDPAARIAELERELRLLGPVNPLAGEELRELEERHQFLQGQLDDVQQARRELGQVIRAVDAEIVEVFAAAYADVEGHFADLFSTLFPGGTGRLSLTAPDDLLATGIEIEARPAGRNVRRLSLLSGGERSLVALAFLFAVFRSRPSPFYLMDEVEAALDEVNLRRFLDLLDQFRGEAQLIVVSHQKRTMEIADALYGVSMQPGGASRVVSEQLRRRAEVS